MRCARKVGLWAGVSVLILMGCGGGADSGDATDAPSSQPTAISTPDTSPATTLAVSTTDATTTTTTVAAPTTTVDPRPIDPEDEALALAAAHQSASFPAPWKVFAEGASSPVSTESCSYQPDGAVTLLTNGASQDGPTMQLGDTGAFVSSSGMAFPDETTAMEYIAVVNTEDWAACRVARLQQYQKDNSSTSIVELATRESDALNQSGFESYVEFHITSADGTLERVAMQSFYRLGRTVIIQVIEYGSLSDSDLDKLVDDAYVALSDSYDRVNELL